MAGKNIVKPFLRNVKSAWREFVGMWRNLLAGIGLAWVLWQLMLLLGGR